MSLYAKAGEEIVCENGHVVARVAKDIFENNIFALDWFDRPIPHEFGEILDCVCGGRFCVGYWYGSTDAGGGLRFRSGLRLFFGGVPYHVPGPVPPHYPHCPPDGAVKVTFE